MLSVGVAKIAPTRTRPIGLAGVIVGALPSTICTAPPGRARAGLLVRGITVPYQAGAGSTRSVLQDGPVADLAGFQATADLVGARQRVQLDLRLHLPGGGQGQRLEQVRTLVL